MCAITLLYFLKHKINFKFNFKWIEVFHLEIVEMSYLMSNVINTHFLIFGFKDGAY